MYEMGSYPRRPYVPFPGWACVMLAAFLWSTSSFFAIVIELTVSFVDSSAGIKYRPLDAPLFTSQADSVERWLFFLFLCRRYYHLSDRDEHNERRQCGGFESYFSPMALSFAALADPPHYLAAGRPHVAGICGNSSLHAGTWRG